MHSQRRALLKTLGLGALALTPMRELLAQTTVPRSTWIPTSLRPFPVPAIAGLSGRVVIVGGGMAGATLAKYLRLWGGTGVQVTLIDRAPFYTSNIMSNLVLNGTLSMSSLYFGYDLLAKHYGVKFLQAEVTAVDPAGRKVILSSGTQLDYDRLVVAPGIEFDTIPGLESPNAQAIVPHAWKAGPQTQALRDQIRAMRRGGVFVMSIPLAPYRCPPGPYERACLVADYLKRNNRGAKVIVLDENPYIIAEPVSFGNAFKTTYSGIVDYRPNTRILSVDAQTKSVSTNNGPVKGDVLNLIPAQRAGAIAAKAGLANAGGGRWAGVDVASYESTVIPRIHVIGDACSSGQPKAGHIANQEAKTCADAVLRALAGGLPDTNLVTNSACYSPITATTASWLTALFALDTTSRTMKVVPGASGEADAPSTDNFEEMYKWFSNLMSDSFA